MNEALLNELSTEVVFIKHLERKLGKKIPLVESLKRGKRGYVLSDGEITGLSLFKCGLEFFPNELEKLKSLEKLYLRRNEIEKLPNSIGFIESLVELDLSINQLKEFPSAVGLLSNLKVLSLRANKIRTLPESIGRLTNLERLDLTSNQLSDIPESVKMLKSVKIDGRGNLLMRIDPAAPEPKTEKRKTYRKGQKSLDEFLK